MRQSSKKEATTARNDLQIYWFESGDERAQDAVTIRLLVSMIDSIIVHLNGRIPYKISARSRAMVAIYPSNGTRYVKHVDNPLRDGRCVTSIYYSNENWNVNQHGGMLRLYPETSAVPVDISPQADRLVLFWSDRRNPHEVMPTFKNR
uniref:hypoxia-inducible factor-proline dioxygenase n=1 Tax=Parascaris equorum TaxID=6256 RepID=A0A914RDN3_PAREQ